MGTFLGLLVRQITRRRLQRKLERMERLNVLERERARIAQDIHDDVGASLASIAMLSQPPRAELLTPERATQMLAGIYSVTKEITRSLDEIVWAVDPRHDTLDSLADYLSRFAQQFLSQAGIRCRLNMPIEVPAWPLPAEVRHNLFLAFKEALNNAVKHAHASEVRLSLGLHDQGFSLVVEDNGKGMSGTDSPPNSERVSSGNGLGNMRQRLERVGGQCTISSDSAGTRVSLALPIPSSVKHQATGTDKPSTD